MYLLNNIFVMNKKNKPKYQFAGKVNNMEDNTASYLGSMIQGIGGMANMIPGAGPLVGMGLSTIGGLVSMAGMPNMTATEFQRKNTNPYGFQFGGQAMAPQGMQGGQPVPLSNNAMQVKAHQPGKTDSIDAGEIMLDHNEVVVGDKVFSSVLKNPWSNVSFAEQEKLTQKALGKFEKFKTKTGDTEMKDKKYHERNSEQLFNTQENVASLLGLRNPDGTPTQSVEATSPKEGFIWGGLKTKMATGGKMGYATGGNDPLPYPGFFGNLYSGFGSYPTYIYGSQGTGKDKTWSYFDPNGKNTKWTEIPKGHAANQQLEKGVVGNYKYQLGQSTKQGGVNIFGTNYTEGIGENSGSIGMRTESNFGPLSPPNPIFPQFNFNEALAIGKAAEASANMIPDPYVNPENDQIIRDQVDLTVPETVFQKGLAGASNFTKQKGPFTTSNEEPHSQEGLIKFDGTWNKNPYALDETQVDANGNPIVSTLDPMAGKYPLDPGQDPKQTFLQNLFNFKSNSPGTTGTSTTTTPGTSTTTPGSKSDEEKMKQLLKEFKGYNPYGEAGTMIGQATSALGLMMNTPQYVKYADVGQDQIRQQNLALMKLKGGEATAKQDAILQGQLARESFEGRSLQGRNSNLRNIATGTSKALETIGGQFAGREAQLRTQIGNERTNIELANQKKDMYQDDINTKEYDTMLTQNLQLMMNQRNAQIEQQLAFNKYRQDKTLESLLRTKNFEWNDEQIKMITTKMEEAKAKNPNATANPTYNPFFTSSGPMGLGNTQFYGYKTPATSTTTTTYTPTYTPIQQRFKLR